MRVVARLKPGITLAQANEDMLRVADYTIKTRPNFNIDWGAVVVPMLEDATSDVHQPLLLLLGAVGFVLLIACANVANLLLMRGAGRERELAVRVALGAARGRVVCQLLAENLVLAIVGTLGGLAIAKWGLGALLALIPEAAPLPRMNSIRIDTTVFLFALGLTFCSTLLFGLLPALRLSRIDLLEALKQGTSRTGVGGNRRVRQSLMVAEIALALMLSVGAGLLLRSFQRLTSVNLGFRTENLVTMRVFVKNNIDATPDRARYLDGVLDAVRGVHGVAAAGFTHALPLTDRVSGSCFALGAQLPEKASDAAGRAVSRREFPLFRRDANADSRRPRFQRARHERRTDVGDRESGICAEVFKRQGRGRSTGERLLDREKSGSHCRRRRRRATNKVERRAGAHDFSREFAGRRLRGVAGHSHCRTIRTRSSFRSNPRFTITIRSKQSLKSRRWITFSPTPLPRRDSNSSCC